MLHLSNNEQIRKKTSSKYIKTIKRTSIYKYGADIMLFISADTSIYSMKMNVRGAY